MHDWIIQADIYRVERALRDERDQDKIARLKRRLQYLNAQIGNGPTRPAQRMQATSRRDLGKLFGGYVEPLRRLPGDA